MKYDGPVCFHMIEVLRHAQASYLLGVIILQIANATDFRTISTTIYKHLFTNTNLNTAYFIEIGLICLLLYTPGLNSGLQLRPLRFENWIPCLGVFLTMIWFTEFTKFLMRTIKNPDGTPGFFYRFFYY